MGVTMPKTHWCEDCHYAKYDTNWRKYSFVCTKGHRPRFYAPMSETFEEFYAKKWGYKRKCADFLAKEAN